MQPNFEATGAQRLPHGCGHRVFSFRNEIEGGSEMKTLFNFSHRIALLEPRLSFDIMCQYQGEPLPFGPSRPTGRRDSGTRINGPFIRYPAQFATGLPAPQR